MVTYIIIGITVIASFYAWNNTSVYYRWMFNPYEVKRKKQYDRFITSGLIHFDYMHLFFNMLSLFFFGKNIEYYFTQLYGNTGIVLYLLMYFLAMAVADVKSYVTHRNDYNYNSLGASGAVSAVIFAAILFDPTRQIYIYFIPIPGILFAVLYLVYSYYAGRQKMDNIGHDAHFYGAIFGVVFTIIIYPKIIPHFLGQLANWL